MTKNNKNTKTEEIKKATPVNFNIESALGLDLIRRNLLLDAPDHKGLGQIADFPFGDDRCLVFHVVNESGDRLFYLWQNGAGLRMEDIGLPASERKFSALSSDPQIREERIKTGIKIIKEYLEREG